MEHHLVCFPGEGHIYRLICCLVVLLKSSTVVILQLFQHGNIACLVKTVVQLTNVTIFHQVLQSEKQ